MEEYYKKKIKLLEEQCYAYQQLVDIQKTDIEVLRKHLELSESIIKKYDEYISLSKIIDGLEEKKKETILNFIEEVRKN